MSHIIVEAKFEDIVPCLSKVFGEIFQGEREIIILEKREDFHLPIIFAVSHEGIIVKVGNGHQHINQALIQDVLAYVVSKLPFKIKRTTVATKILRRYGISYP